MYEEPDLELKSIFSSQLIEASLIEEDRLVRRKDPSDLRGRIRANITALGSLALGSMIRPLEESREPEFISEIYSINSQFEQYSENDLTKISQITRGLDPNQFTKNSEQSSLTDMMTELSRFYTIDEVEQKSPDFEFKKIMDYIIENGGLTKPFGEDFSVDDTLVDTTQPQRWTELQRAAHSYRARRMKMGPLADMARDLQDRPDLKPFVSAMTRRASDILEGRTKRDLKSFLPSGTVLHHSEFAPLISGRMLNPELRTDFMDRIDQATSIESDELKAESREQGSIKADIVVIGTGIHASVFAAKYRAINPDARVVCIDRNEKIGGQFRNYGDRPVFRINSRNFRRQDNTDQGLPGETGNLNSFGTNAPVQLTDITTSVYPNNIDMGDTAAINLHLSASSMVGVALAGSREYYDESGTVRNEITVTDTETGEEYLLDAPKVVLTSGAGGREAGDSDTQLTAEQVLSMFGDKDNLFPMDRFINKNIGIKGGGDTGRILAEELSGLGPDESYGLSNVQLGRIGSITWYGTDFTDKDSYCDKNRGRYSPLSSFITRDGTSANGAQIFPTTDKVVTQTETFDGKVFVTTDTGDTGYHDIMIDATNLRTDILDYFDELEGIRPLTTPGTSLNIMTGESTQFTQKIGNTVFMAGPIARSPLTLKEKDSFNEGITENTVAIWANTPRTEHLAQTIDRL